MSIPKSGKTIDWYANYTKDLEEQNEELHKAIAAKDEALAGYKWEVESLKRKIR